MFPLLRATLLAVGLTLSLSASSFQVNYNLNLGSGTLNGNAVTNIAIFETDGTQANLDFPYSVAGSGQQLLSHLAPFIPTFSLIVGLDLPSLSGGDGKTHIVFFSNDAFAQSAAGIKFSSVFPNTRHNDFISRLLAGEAGDATQQAWLANFFTAGDGAAARFATAGPSTAVEFTNGVIISGVPEPATAGMAALGLAAAFFAARRRK